MPSVSNVPPDYVHERTLRVLIGAAARCGVTVDCAALESGAAHEVDVLVPTEHYQKVLRSIFARGDDCIGLRLAQELPLGASGLWGLLLRTSPTYGALLRRAQRYLRLFFRFTRVELRVESSGLVLVCDHPHPAPFGRAEQEVGFFLGQWMTWGRTLVGPGFHVERVRMRWSGPTDAEPWTEFFGCPVEFASTEDALAIGADVLALPLPESTPELAAVFEQQALAVIEQLGPKAGWGDRVRAAIAQGLPIGADHEGAIAEHFCITRRTLRRRLAEEQLTFRAVRRAVLEAQAKALLRDRKLTLDEVSFLLGYSQPATFQRAFRSWTGAAPGTWRKRCFASLEQAVP